MLKECSPKVDFSVKKLPLQNDVQWVKVSVGDLKPYTVLAAPAYVLLRRNERYLAIKGPLDFFTPSECEALRPFETIYHTSFIKNRSHHRKLAAAVRRILGWNDESTPHPVDPFERSDSVARVLAQALGPDLAWEPLFMTFFADDLLGPHLPRDLVEVRDQSVAQYERGLLGGAFLVFVAMLLGELELGYLSRLRRAALRGESLGDPRLAEALAFFSARGPVDILKVWNSSALLELPTLGPRLRHRLGRVAGIAQNIPVEEQPTVFGKDGFLDG